MRHLPLLLLAFTAACACIVVLGPVGSSWAGPRIIEVDDGSGTPKPAPPPVTPPSQPQAPPPSSEPADGGVAVGYTPLPPGYHAHDGLMFRIMAVVDYWSSTEGAVEVTAVGVPILSGSVELGIALFDDFIFGIEGFFHGGPGLEVTRSDGSTDDTIEASIFGGGLGAGFNYYFSPTNVYLGVTGGAAGMSFSDDTGAGGSGTSETGFYVGLKAGYEWWLTANWGVGVGTRFIYTQLPDDGSTIHNLGIGFGLSATLN